MISVVGVLTSIVPSASVAAVYDAEAARAIFTRPVVVGFTARLNEPSARVFADPRVATLVVVLPLTVVVVVTVIGRLTPATGTIRPSTSRVRVPDTVTGSPYHASRVEMVASRSGLHWPTVLAREVGVAAAYTLVAAVFAANVVATLTVAETVAEPLAADVPLPAEEAVPPVTCLVKAVARPLIGRPVAVSVRVAVTGVGAPVHTEAELTSPAVWPATDRSTVTGRAVLTAKVSGLETTLVAPVESVRVAVTVVALDAAAAQVTSDWISVGLEKTQSALGDFQATEARVRPVGSTGVTDTWVARPGTAGLFTPIMAPRTVGLPADPPPLPLPPPIRNRESAEFQCVSSQDPGSG